MIELHKLEELAKAATPDSGNVYAECADCDCCGPSGERLEDAIDAWETRPEVGG